MKSTLKGLLTFCFIALLSLSSKAWTSNYSHWEYIYTSTNHIILVNPNVLLDGAAAPTTNCWVGVFFEKTNGEMQCAGYSEYSGVLGSVTAWGVDGSNNGFAVNEVFTWKLLKVVGSDTTEYDGVAVYDPLQPDFDAFVVNGISGVTSLIFASALNLKAVNWVTPQSYCGLSSTEVVSVSITNDTSGVVAEPYDVAYSIDGGATWVTETFSTTVNPDSTVVLTFAQTADFSAFGGTVSSPVDSTYNVMFKIIFPKDIDSLDNEASSQVTNMLLPTVIASGLAAEYCFYPPELPPIQLTGIPAGGTFMGDGVQGNNFLIGTMGFPMVGVGNHCVEYTYFDATTGCMGADTICTIVHPIPNATLTAPSWQMCIYDTVQLTGSPVGGEYFGTYVNQTTGKINPVTPGSFQIFYKSTNAFGCIDTSDYKTMTVHSLPTTTLVNLDRAYCTNGSPVTLVGNPAGGIYSIGSGVAVTGNQLNPALLTPGVHAIKYQYTDTHGCKNSISQNIKAFAPPVVSLTGLETEYCKLDAPDTLVGTPISGVWSGAATTNVFNPINTGIFNVTYTYAQMQVAFADTVYCSDFDTESTIVRALPNFDIAAGHPLTTWGDIETCSPGTITLSAGIGGTYLWSTGSTINQINNLSYGGYTLTVTNNYGCSNTDSLFIGGTDVKLIANISPASNCTIGVAEPVILQYTNVATKTFLPTEKIYFNAKLENGNMLSGFDTRTAPFKPGDTLTMQFSTPFNNAAILAGVGEYDMLAFLHYDNQIGTNPDCKLSNDTLKTVILNGGFPAPSFPQCPIHSNMPDTVVLNPGDFASYQWSTGETTNSITNLAFNTQYIVTVTDEFGCQETIACGVEDIEELPTSYESMNVFPNPNNGEFTLQVQNKTYATISYELVDLSGRVISTKEEEATREFIQKINMRERAKGVYFLKVYNGKDYAIQKIIKY